MNSFRNLEDKNYLDNDLFQETWEDWGVDDQHLKRKSGYGKQIRLSNPGKLKSTSQRDSSFRGGVEPPYNWFAEGFTSAGISSGLSLFFFFLKSLLWLVHHLVPSHSAEIYL